MPSVPPWQLPNCERAPGDMALSGLAVPATLARSLSSLCSPASGASRRAGPAVFVAAAVDLLTRVRAAALGHVEHRSTEPRAREGRARIWRAGLGSAAGSFPPGCARATAPPPSSPVAAAERRERGEGEKWARVFKGGGRPAVLFRPGALRAVGSHPTARGSRSPHGPSRPAWERHFPGPGPSFRAWSPGGKAMRLNGPGRNRPSSEKRIWAKFL